MLDDFIVDWKTHNKNKVNGKVDEWDWNRTLLHLSQPPFKNRVIVVLLTIFFSSGYRPVVCVSSSCSSHRIPGPLEAENTFQSLLPSASTVSQLGGILWTTHAGNTVVLTTPQGEWEINWVLRSLAHQVHSWFQKHSETGRARHRHIGRIISKDFL